jgi:hypothetical protein
MRDSSQFQCDKSAVRQREGFLWLLDKSPSSQDKTPLLYTSLSLLFLLPPSLSLLLSFHTDTQESGERPEQNQARKDKISL